MSIIDDVDIIVRRKGERFVAALPQFALFASGRSASDALDALEEKKTALIAGLEEAGELDLLTSARKALPDDGYKRTDAGSLRGFLVKTCIVVAAIVLVIGISGAILAGQFERGISELKSVKIGGSQFWGGLEKELDRMASSETDLPEAKKQKLLGDIRAIVAKWRPFVVELQSLSTPPAAGSKSTELSGH